MAVRSEIITPVKFFDPYRFTMSQLVQGFSDAPSSCRHHRGCAVGPEAGHNIFVRACSARGLGTRNRCAHY